MSGDDEVDQRPGSVGRPQPGVEVRTGDDGGLEVRSPYLFDGYADDPNTTAEALVDGWFRTGDLAEVDPDGCWSITGRIGSVIRTGGESVTPGEVEEAIARHPAVAEVAVVGLPDAEWGEIVTAVVVPLDQAPGAHVSTEWVREVAALDVWCRDQLARHKVPRRFESAQALPRTAATGQIRRPLIVEMLQAGVEVTSTGGAS